MCYHDFQYVALIFKVELFEEEELIADGKSSSEIWNYNARGSSFNSCLYFILYSWFIVFKR